MTVELQAHSKVEEQGVIIHTDNGQRHDVVLKCGKPHRDGSEVSAFFKRIREAQNYLQRYFSQQHSNTQVVSTLNLVSMSTLNRRRRCLQVEQDVMLRRGTFPVAINLEERCNSDEEYEGTTIGS